MRVGETGFFSDSSREKFKIDFSGDVLRNQSVKCEISFPKELSSHLPPTGLTKPLPLPSIVSAMVPFVSRVTPAIYVEKIMVCHSHPENGKFS
jgi:hypothetical protein